MNINFYGAMNKACEIYEIDNPQALNEVFYEVASFTLGYMCAEGKFTDRESGLSLVDVFPKHNSVDELWEKLQEEKNNAE